MPFHWYDMLVLVVLGLVVFGPKRLPEMGSSLGKTIREFQKSMREVTNPEPPTSIPPSAAQTAQSVTPATAAPVIAAAPVAAAQSEPAPVVQAESHVEASAETPTETPTPAPVVAEEGVAPRVEEDALR